MDKQTRTDITIHTYRASVGEPWGEGRGNIHVGTKPCRGMKLDV